MLQYFQNQLKTRLDQESYNHFQISEDLRERVDGDTATVQIATSLAELNDVQNAVTLTLN